MIILSLADLFFPDPFLSDFKNEPAAIGGDLSSERLWLAYQMGFFPWYNPDEEILWWCLDPRFVLYPSELKVSSSMKKIMKKNSFTFTENQCFRRVMEECAAIKRNEQDGTWISENLINSFEVLHSEKKAMSVEAWEGSELVGGFYGVVLDRVFCGESMFSKTSNASKAAFIYFVQKYKSTFELIDCQTHTNHLESLGARMIPKLEFLKILNFKKNESK